MIGADQITLWAVCGRPDPLLLDRTLRVLRYCESLAPWSAKVLFTVSNPEHYPKTEHGLRVIQIPEFEWNQWQIFVGKTISSFLTGYAWSLRVDEDGFPVEPSLWHEGFMDYDYVGSPWPHSGLVGSGGCALSSHVFNHAVGQLPWYDGKDNFDEFVCRVHRQKMLELGIKFAPPEVAIKFCTESTDQKEKSFAFHGRRHAPEKYRLAWEKLEAWEKSAGWK